MDANLINRVYRNPIPGVAAIGFLRVQRAVRPMDVEWHENCYELLFMLSGEKLFRVGAEEHLLRGGDLVCVHPGETHDGLEIVQTRSSLCYVIFRDPAAWTRFLGLSDRQRAEMASRLSALRVARADQEALRILERLDVCLREDDALREPRLSALLLLLIDAATRGAAEREDAPPEIERAVLHIREHPEQPLSVGDLACIAGLSEARFKQRFKRFVGMPPAEYVLRERVRLAERMLREGCGVAQTAMRLGFSSAQHFSHVFKRYRGQSPSAYRASLTRDE